MEANQVPAWRRDILGRIDVLIETVRRTMQIMERDDVDILENKAEIEVAWATVYERFPDDFTAARENDFMRHLSFGYYHDLSDILNLDIPAIKVSIVNYRNTGDERIEHELDRLNLNLEIWELIHPTIRDAVLNNFENGDYRRAAFLAIELALDEIRRMSGRTDDGDSLLRRAVGVTEGDVAFSQCRNDNEKAITNGLKQVMQGLYKGVRNPDQHAGQGFSRVHTYQVICMVSLLLSKLCIVESQE